MRTYPRATVAVLLAALVLTGAAAPRAVAGQPLLRGTWDQLSLWLVPRFVEKNSDFASIIAHVRQASCLMEVELRSGALEEPLSGAIRYTWDDMNESGMLSGRELQIRVERASSPILQPFLDGLCEQLLNQTIYYYPFFFQLNNIKAIEIEGGYKMRLRPASEGAANVLGYSVAYLTLTGDFRATELRTESPQGVETTFRFKHRKAGDRWLSAGYLRSVVTPTARAEEDRSEVYKDVDGVHLLSEVTVQTFVATSTGAAQVEQKYTFKDWQVQRREKPVVPTGVRAEDIDLIGPPTREPAPGDYRLVKTLTGHTQAVLDVAVSPDGALAASAGMDKTVRLWDLAAGKCVHVLEGHTTPVNAVAFTPDGKRLVSGAGDAEGPLRLWDVASGDFLKTLAEGPRVIFAVACTPDGAQIVAGGEGGTLIAWDAKTGERLEPLAGHLYDVYALACPPPNPQEKNAQALLASGSADRAIRLWKLEGTTWPGQPGECFGTLTADRQVAAVAVAWNGQRLATGGTDKTITLWDTATGRPQKTLEGHRRWIECLAFAPVPGSPLLASGSRDMWVRIWDAEAGKCIQVLDDHEDTVRALDFAPDGTRLVTAGDDRTVRVYERKAPLPKPPPPEKAAETPEGEAEAPAKKE